MKKNVTLVDCDAERLKQLRNEIKLIRYWFSGFRAARTENSQIEIGIIPDQEVLRQLMILFDHSISKHKS